MSLSQAAENYPACRRSDESAPFRLRALNSSKKILLIGHSGGAAMTALLASRFPASADAYLLAACRAMCRSGGNGATLPRAKQSAGGTACHRKTK